MLEEDMVDDKELEDQLLEAGKRLEELPEDVEELLTLLELIEGYLTRVEQSPSKSMQTALLPTMNALAASDLLRHRNPDVKVSVASCVSEITRITAPDAPYSDDQMKQIFQLIVTSFEMLWDTSSRSYSRRISVLETVAKVRSCVVMLDLECDTLIQEMFQHFLKTVSDSQPESVLSSMETIMSLVLEESEDIPPELLYPLLNSVKKENQSVSPVARKLGEKVLENCTSKLKPYLTHAVKSMGMSPNNFSKIVVSICQEKSDTTEHNDDSVSGERLVTEELKPYPASPVEVDTESERSTKVLTSNGDAQDGKDDDSVGVDSPIKESSTLQTAQFESDSSGAQLAKEETKPDPTGKRKRGKKANNSIEVPEGSGRSKIENKEDINSLSKDHSTSKTVSRSRPAEKDVAQVPSMAASQEELVKVESSPLSQSLPDGGRSKRGRPARAKKGNANEDTDTKDLTSDQVESDYPTSTEVVAQVLSPAAARDGPVDGSSPLASRSVPDGGRAKRGSSKKVNTKEDTGCTSVPKEPLSSEHVESDAQLSTDTISKSEPEEENEIEEKSNRRSGIKKGQSVRGKEGKGSGATSDSDEKPLKKSGKKAENVRGSKDAESSGKKKVDKNKKGSRKSNAEKDLPGGSSNKKKPTGTPSSNNQKPLEETPKTKSKRKRTDEKDKASEKPSGEVLGKNLVGAKIKVWWPDDSRFYEGVVDSFDHKTKKHKVSYNDGDEEILLLKNERWEFIDADNMPDKEQEKENELSSPDASEMPHKKKAKTNTDSARGKKDATTQKKGKGASTSKSKDEAPKTATKSRSTPKSGSKSKDSSQKTGTKAKEDAPKTGTKSNVESPKDATPKGGSKSKSNVESPKDATPKGGSKSKSKSKDATPKSESKVKDAKPKVETKPDDDTAKTGTKSKNLTPKSGSKSGATNGTSVKEKPGASKVQESDGAEKDKASDSAKAQDSDTKSGKKRRRVKGE